MARVLVADDDDGVRSFLADALVLDGHEVAQAVDGRDAMHRLSRDAFHVLVTDLKMPNLDGMALLRWVRAEQPEVEVVVLTAHGGVASAVEAMKLGAIDYLQKPLSGPAELRLVVNRAVERHRLRAADEVPPRPSPLLTWGAPAMIPVVDALTKVAVTEATVLLLGESGTGKEVAARAVHALSPRRNGPFSAVNCAALTESLLESELFGHERGAFTGAVEQRRGRLELAEGGTFFLDEVGELSPPLQAKLLRVLQERTYERVGGSRTLRAEVRWIAATHHDLLADVAAGRFREDLYHRLAVFPITLPPLRDRPEDVVPLAHALLLRVGPEVGRRLTLTPAAEAAIAAGEWRGNVRALRNALERAAILCGGGVIDAPDLLVAPRTSPTPAATAPTMAEAEEEAIRAALAVHGGNRRLAAAHLGIGTRTLYDKLAKYGID